MATPYSNIYARFLQKVQDYNIDALMAISESDMETYLLGFLKGAVVKFQKCATDLSDRDDSEGEFANTLTEYEEEILAVCMLYEWCVREVNNILDIRLGLNDTDFKRYSEQQNLQGKLKWKKDLEHERDILITAYTYDTADYTTLG